MLPDLALGGVIRNQIGLALPLPTVSMTIQLAPGRAREVAWADAECPVQLDRTASARSQLFTADGEVVGDAVGVFALPKLPYDGPGRAMPWDLPIDDHSRKKDPAWAESVPLSADGSRWLTASRRMLSETLTVRGARSKWPSSSSAHVRVQVRAWMGSC